MSQFLTPLRTEALMDPAGMPLKNKDGRRLYRLIDPLVYRSDLVNQEITAPAGFITDFGSVPRLPIIFDALGEIAQEPFVIHDICYSKGLLPRDLSDQVLEEALALVGTPWYKVKAIYAGVRIGGAGHYGS